MIRRATPADLGVVRALRLEALRLAPTAYGSTLEREEAFDDTVWAGRLQPDAYPTFVWEDDTGGHGSVVGAACPDDPADAHSICRSRYAPAPRLH